MESIRQNIEYNTVRVTDEAKEIREKAGIHGPAVYVYKFERVFIRPKEPSMNPSTRLKSS